MSAHKFLWLLRVGTPMDNEGENCHHGDEWPSHYRGYRLHVNPAGDVWWQLYNGTERLILDSDLDDLVDDLLDLKRLGGRIRITETGDVITKVEEDGADDRAYETQYVGQVELDGNLVPEDDPEFGIEITPDGLSEGDLWPSVYDGSRYSFSGDQVWWQNPETHRRHYVKGSIDSSLLQTLRRYKPDGGSFRVTPQGDVITLIPYHPTPAVVEDQFGDLPVVVRNIIKLRKEKGVEMLPIFVGKHDGKSIEVGDATTLSGGLSDSEQEELESWAKSLGRRSSISKTNHSASPQSTETGSSEESEKGGAGAETTESGPTEVDTFDDDPIAQIRNELEETGRRINEQIENDQ